MESKGIQIIQACNQQFYPVLLSSLILAYFDFNLLSIGWTNIPFILSIGLCLSSTILSFGYLMLLTSTYEHTKSYSKSRELCNNLAFASSFIFFLSIVTFGIGLVGQIYTKYNSIYIGLIITISTCIIVSIGYVFMIGYRWRQIIISQKLALLKN